MRISKAVYLTLVAMVLMLATLPGFTDARYGSKTPYKWGWWRKVPKSGGHSRSIIGWRRGNYKGGYYSGTVVIPVTGGTFTNGYGN